MNRTIDRGNTEFSIQQNYTACLAFSTGECFLGLGFGDEGVEVGEICFNTSMTGYQEILTDLSYAGQIVNFTFPHIGNTGTNMHDNESISPVALGMICRNLPTEESNWLSEESFETWLEKNKIIGIGQVDTRRITRLIRSSGAQSVAIGHSRSGRLNIKKLLKMAKEAKGLKNVDLSEDVTCLNSYLWNCPKIGGADVQTNLSTKNAKSRIIAIDYGAKQTIFKQLANEFYEVVVVPAGVHFKEIINLKPDGIFLSNGPGDPLATFNKFGRTIVELITQSKIPIFGICLGHQLLGLALGATTIKMTYGHHGANHPVLNVKTGKVEIASMNHGFAIDSASLPMHVTESHVSLFDGSNCGIEVAQKKIFSVQHHPEASPGPHDSHYLFEKFFKNIKDTYSTA